ncbi:nuclear transport factor 2 family protein [Sporosarcina sp. HYO08]|uniref:nuclear transport factor 2 family protein n=1 Tax=Sporosarcina sp. HYO08 TaxID=1759557 RepID=UPI0007969D15|nr:nuclear transport factor 2 family protein [Sporosarcina sp. HYO08]KXH84119.1 hypothetical protein AU377_05065 [Sporosarcina sp. HYO08]
MRKVIALAVLSLLLLLLGACSKDEGASTNHGSVNDGEMVNGYGTIDHGVNEDQKVGFNLTGDTIEEAAGVPAEEKTEILKTFNTYMDAFNEKNMDTYLDILSDHSESFNKTEEREYMESVFQDYDLNRQATDVTIVKFKEDEAQVFSRITTTMKQLETGFETNQKGKQVTVFTKDNSEWKVASVYYIGEEE